MKKEILASAFENNVVLRPGEHEEVLCPHCDEPLVFGMKDKTHSFSMGLTKILECLVIAEQMGYVPPFPDEWWVLASRRYSFLPEIRERLIQQKE